MVNYQSQSHVANNANASNIHDRRQQWGRLASHCPPPLKFLESFCDPNDNEEGSLQRYKIRCETQFHRETPITAARQGRVNSIYVRTGHCDDEEICLDVRSKNPHQKIASCNRVEIFEEWDYTKDGKFQPIVNGEVFEPFVSMYGVVSQIDRRTPMEVDKLEMDTWSSDEDTGQGDVQTKSCRGCVNVQTDVLAPQTDSLKVEARLLSGVTAAATAGILWLTIVTAG